MNALDLFNRRERKAYQQTGSYQSCKSRYYAAERGKRYCTFRGRRYLDCGPLSFKVLK